MPRPRTITARSLSLLLVAGLLALSGCGGFFYKEPSGGGGGGGGTTVNYAYVGNQGASTVAGFTISTTGQLTAVTNSPYSLPAAPLSVAVSHANTFLYVGTAAGIYGFAIGTNGVLTAVANSTLLTTGTMAAMDTSPDGKWLLALDSLLSQVVVYSINSDGTLGLTSKVGYSFANATPVARDLRISPSGAFVVAALGSAGDIVHTFNTTTGAIAQSKFLAVTGTSSDNALAFDPTTTYLYIARSGDNQGLLVCAIGSDASLSCINGSPFATGRQPYGVVVDITGKYVYVANRGDNNLTGYSIVSSAGVVSTLTPITGSPFASGLAITPLAADSTGKWILGAAFNGTPDLTLYGFDTTTPGKLNSTATIATGTNADSIALTH